MAKFIELTGRDGKKKFINTKAIISFCSVTISEKNAEERIPYTEVRTSEEVIEHSGNTFYASETTDEIKEKINSINKIA